jgi:tRNA (guanine-N7-)-methyltransferase
MAQKKLLRFSQIKSFSNVAEYPKDMAGNWTTFFQKPQPLVIELACGRGEYTIGLAELFSDRNHLGVDVKGNRIYLGAKKALDQSIQNAGFLRTQIEMINDYFASAEVDEIWITFPDPQLRTSKAKKRLTHPRFLRMYQKMLKPGGVIHLKTDSPDLYAFTLLSLKHSGIQPLETCDDVYALENRDPRLNIQTHYERLDIAQSQKIHYIQFSLPDEPLENKDEELQTMLK